MWISFYMTESYVDVTFSSKIQLMELPKKGTLFLDFTLILSWYNSIEIITQKQRND